MTDKRSKGVREKGLVNLEYRDVSHILWTIPASMVYNETMTPVGRIRGTHPNPAYRNRQVFSRDESDGRLYISLA